MLLTDRLLALDADPEVQRDILFTQMDDAYATIMRQIFFAIFEVDAHEAINNGASVDELCELYLDNLREQFGESVDVSDDFKYEWVPFRTFTRFRLCLRLCIWATAGAGAVQTVP